MRLLVGTLSSGEQELPRNIESVRNQTLGDVEQKLFQGLPKREAHRRLYEYFMSREHEFDAFVKLDADMVLASHRKLEEISSYLRRNPGLDAISIPVWDYFTDSLISGLNVYRNHVRWDIGNDLVFTDQQPSSAKSTRIGITTLAPAASHADDPTDITAVHFGLHRAVKAMTRLGTSESHGLQHDQGVAIATGAYLDPIDKTERHYDRTRDRRLALALLGAEWGFSAELGHRNLDYGDHKFKSLVTQFLSSFDVRGESSVVSAKVIMEEVHRLRAQSPLPTEDRLALLKRYRAFERKRDFFAPINRVVGSVVALPGILRRRLSLKQKQ